MTVDYAGIDWLTCTSKSDDVGQSWYRLYCKYKEEQPSKSVFEQHFSNGYYSGLAVGSLKWGYSERLGYILIASGGDAMLIWPKMKPAKHRITRLDLCVDFLLDEPLTLATTAYKEALAKENKKNLKYTLFTNSDGGTTVYVGSRQSMQYGRLYDKGVESGKAPVGCLWRYEVEYKKPLSGEIANHLADGAQSRLTQEVVNRVGDWFGSRGVESAKTLSDGPVKPIFVEQRITTEEKKLAWLSAQVAPTVSRLVEAGLGKEVLKCLLLDERAIRDILATEA